MNFNFSSAALVISKETGKKLENVHKLEYISGCSLEKLIELFAAGYTLKGPEEPMNMKKLSKEINRDRRIRFFKRIFRGHF